MTEIVALFPDKKTVSIEVDPWGVAIAVESFYEIGAERVYVF